jgi:hypothetical protein
MGPAAEIFGYRSTILIGICGRVATRFLLIYGSSLLDMQLMQATYSMGSAAEDVFKAYVFYAISHERHQLAFSSTAASSLLSNVFSGILGIFFMWLLPFTYALLAGLRFTCRG